jgi:hypothetical protein
MRQKSDALKAGADQTVRDIRLEIIHLVERSHLPVRRTLEKLGIPTTTFYRWYDRYRALGHQGLVDRSSGPGRVWNRIPDEVGVECG